MRRASLADECWPKVRLPAGSGGICRRPALCRKEGSDSDIRRYRLNIRSQKADIKGGSSRVRLVPIVLQNYFAPPSAQD
jgi:hypothetical protein